MLLPWRDEVRLLVTPRAVALQRRAGRGGAPQARWVAIAETPTLDAGAALDALDTLLAAAPMRGARASVVLSGHFAHCALVPESPLLVTHDDDLRFARHNFTRVFGEAAATWSVRASRGADAAIASGVAQDLVDGLRARLRVHGIVPASLQPALAAAFNAARATLPAPNALLIALEPDLAVSAVLRAGVWVRVRSQRIADASAASLRRLVERERLLEPDAEALPVCVVPVLPVNGVAKAGGDLTWHEPLFAASADAVAPELAAEAA